MVHPALCQAARKGVTSFAQSKTESRKSWSASGYTRVPLSKDFIGYLYSLLPLVGFECEFFFFTQHHYMENSNIQWIFLSLLLCILNISQVLQRGKLLKKSSRFSVFPLEDLDLSSSAPLTNLSSHFCLLTP
jgi:hypothetical protein